MERINTEWKWFDDVHGGGLYRVENGTLQVRDEDGDVDIDLYRGTCCEAHSADCLRIAAELGLIRNPKAVKNELGGE